MEEYYDSNFRIRNFEFIYFSRYSPVRRKMNMIRVFQDLLFTMLLNFFVLNELS